MTMSLHKTMTMHLSKFGRCRFIDCTGKFPVYVYEDGTRLKQIKIGGKNMPERFDTLSTKGVFYETRPSRLIEESSTNGVFVHTYIFQNVHRGEMKFDLQTLRSYVDSVFSNNCGVKFVGTFKQASQYWDELNQQNIWIKQDFERFAKPNELKLYYNNNKQILFL